MTGITLNKEAQKITVQNIKGSMMILAGLIVICASTPTTSVAAEGASSHYLPGAVGDAFLAVPPEPGLTAANTFWYQTGGADTAVLEGQISLGIDLELFLNLVSFSYTLEHSVLGGRFTVGGAVPFGYAGLEGSITGPRGGSLSFSDDSFDLSDIALIPFQMNWSAGRWSFKLGESIVAPTGGYDSSGSDLANLGRNYWSFDTVAAVTWFNPDSGTEISIAPGIMFNTENPDTDYQTGTEFHLDFVFNQFFSETFALGLRGYYYKQLSGDSGVGATLGDFESESFAVGPGVIWMPGFGNSRLTVLGKWLHDFSADNRFESDYITLTVAWKF
ncbi:MAG: hypothetical protein D6B25_05535 [Desulfobulbaceae bacterium]|nr:MAG: hypothetical protein D6B25_05535 [Desulfobulbaceae bacterium]